MILRHHKHSVPGLNTTSTADISFMLLFFFLVTSNMDVDKGLTRQLPPADQKNQQEESFVKKGTLMTLKVDAAGHLTVDDKPMKVTGLRRQIIAFVNGVGKRHLIKVDVDPMASYDVYFQIQNEIVAAYRVLRNDAARHLYGKGYSRLTNDQRERVKDACPQRVAEIYNGSQTASAAPAASQTTATETGKGGLQ